MHELVVYKQRSFYLILFRKTNDNDMNMCLIGCIVVPDESGPCEVNVKTFVK